MAIVLLHGNPETPVIWGPLIDALRAAGVDQPIITPQLPGFGCPTPAGFAATKEAYVDWFTAQLRQVVDAHGPAHVVGHDWGGAISLRAVDRSPHLAASWACDVLGLFHPEYVWHDFAQIWQTPQAGEEYFEQQLASPPADRVALFNMIGIPSPIAEQLVDVADEEMSRCILALYRSAAQPAMTVWGDELSGAATVPGLGIQAPDDPFVRSHDLGPQIAASLGAPVRTLAGQGHWWMLNDPVSGAAALTEFWSTLS